jgi:hypothetical protein
MLGIYGILYYFVSCHLFHVPFCFLPVFFFRPFYLILFFSDLSFVFFFNFFFLIFFSCIIYRFIVSAFTRCLVSKVSCLYSFLLLVFCVLSFFACSSFLSLFPSVFPVFYFLWSFSLYCYSILFLLYLASYF